MPAPGEALWLADDTEKALAYELAKREVCSGCGTRREQWFDEDGRRHDPPLLEAVTRHCEGCAEKARLQLDIDADLKHTTHGNSETAGRALAGLFIALGPFDPEV